MRLSGWALALLLSAFAGSASAQSVCPVPGHTAKVVAAATLSGTSYTIGGTDLCRTLVFNQTGVGTVTLPYVTVMGGYNFWTKIFQAGSGNLVITPSAPPLGGTAPTINGSTSLSLATTKSATIYFGTDGNWYATYSGG